MCGGTGAGEAGVGGSVISTNSYKVDLGGERLSLREERSGLKVSRRMNPLMQLHFGLLPHEKINFLNVKKMI